MTDDPRWARPGDGDDQHGVDWTPPPELQRGVRWPNDHDEDASTADAYERHAAEAERLLAKAARLEADPGDTDPAAYLQALKWEYLTRAQVHASLASAAAVRAHVDWLQHGGPT